MPAFTPPAFPPPPPPPIPRTAPLLCRCEKLVPPPYIQSSIALYDNSNIMTMQPAGGVREALLKLELGAVAAS